MAAARHSLLFIHGAGGGGWEWNLWLGLMRARGHVCLAPDWQPAPAGLAQTQLDDYLQQMRDALRTLPQPRALVGASLGGLLAAMLAAQQDASDDGSDDAVQALVLVNALPPAPWHAQLPQRQWPQIVPWQREARLASTRRSMNDADAASALWAFRHWRDESGLALRQAQAGIHLPRPKARLRMIVAADDTDVPASIGRQWAQHWQADLDWLPSGGHLSPLFAPVALECASRCADWLSAG